MTPYEDDSPESIEVSEKEKRLYFITLDTEDLDYENYREKISVLFFRKLERVF